MMTLDCPEDDVCDLNILLRLMKNSGEIDKDVLYEYSGLSAGRVDYLLETYSYEIEQITRDKFTW